jgi:hypothetical protein
MSLDLYPAGPGERAELVRTLEVRAALVAVPADEGVWRVPLGLAGHADPGDGTAIYIDAAGLPRRTGHARAAGLAPTGGRRAPRT